jgi:carboxyl-terminal processing protease
MNRIAKYVVAALVALILALASFVAGVAITKYLDGRGGSLPELPSVVSPQKSSDDALIDEVRTIIRREALKPSSDDSMTANAISGMLKSLPDTYAAYFDPKHFGFFKEETTGQFGGIGVTLSVKDGHAVIVQPLKNTPAVKAGLKAGDEIVLVDGWSKKGWTSEEVVSRVRGKEGTKVKLRIRRKGVKDFDVTITRAKIDTPNITTEMVGKDVGYMRLFSFNANARKDIRDAIAKFDKQGAKGYVLDLRENPGGLLSEGVDVASLFVKDGPIVRVDQRDQPEDVELATGGKVTDKPLVVLIDGDSASAAEIVAGALQDYKRATLVGAKSFGKGSVQTVRDLPNGGAVKLTIAHYLTPKKRAIDGIGLTPDVVVPMDPRLQADKKTDKQLQRALEVLRSKF